LAYYQQRLLAEKVASAQITGSFQDNLYS